MSRGALVIHRASCYTGLHLQGFLYRASYTGLLSKGFTLCWYVAPFQGLECGKGE